MNDGQNMNNPLNPTIRDALDKMRKSLTASQQRRFLTAAKQADPSTRALCETLYWTGCRLSEAIALRHDQLDTDECCVVFETLKQRESHPCYRAVPVPPPTMQRLLQLPAAGTQRLWPYSRWTAHRRYKHVMQLADLDGRMATARALRHSYNKRNLENGVPAIICQTLLGHRKPETNAIYSQFIGGELTPFVSPTWEEPS
jgi:site-specific recombinase XerD